MNVMSSMDGIISTLAEAITTGLMSIFENWPVVIMQLIATAILFIFIRLFLWKPITRFLTARQEALTKELEDVRAEKETIAQVKADTLQEYEDMKNEARFIKDSILREAQTEKERIITEARSEAKRRISQVEHDVAQEIRDSNTKIRETIKEIAFAAAEKIIQQEVNEEQHLEMVNELIDEKL